uniref:Condensin complex subunit 1 n=1 Tax=Timema poppense TaxID=170557 RepID=A0A7R9GU75_TIMPO|nr:unnamed protein product [Timema poppensis]
MDWEFVIPMVKDDLLSSGEGEYKVENVWGPLDVRDRFSSSKAAFNEDLNVVFILDHFDTFFSILLNIKKVDLSFLQLNLEFLLKVCKELKSHYLTNALSVNEILPEQRKVHLNTIKMLLYLITELSNGLEDRLSEKSADALLMEGGKGRKKGTKKFEEDEWDWQEKKTEVVEMLYSILLEDMDRFWDPPVVEQDFVNLFANTCYKFLEDSSISLAKSKNLRNSIMHVLGILLKRYRHVRSFIIKVMQLLKLYEHLVTPLAQGVVVAVNEYSCNNIVKELVREFSILESADLAQDAVGTRSYSQFLVELAENLPALMLPITDLLTPYLDDEPYIMRNCVLTVMSEIVLKVLTSENLDNASLKNRNFFLQKLQEHLLDVNAFVRSKALQLWLKLCREHAIPIAWHGPLLTCVVDRLHDKSSNVKKFAVQVLTAFLEGNPFAAKLGLKELEAQFELEQANLKKLREDHGVIEEEEEEAEVNRVATVFQKMESKFRTAVQELLQSEENINSDSEDSESSDSSLADILEQVKSLLNNGKFIEAVKLLRKAEKQFPEDKDLKLDTVQENRVDHYILLMKKVVTSPTEEEPLPPPGPSSDSGENSQDIVTEPSQETETPAKLAIKKQKADSITFVKILSKALPLIAGMMHSAQVTDILEAVEFFKSAFLFGLSDASMGVRHMLALVWSQEQNIKDAVAGAYNTLYLTVENTNPRGPTARHISPSRRHHCGCPVLHRATRAQTAELGLYGRHTPLSGHPSQSHTTIRGVTTPQIRLRGSAREKSLKDLGKDRDTLPSFWGIEMGEEVACQGQLFMSIILVRALMVVKNLSDLLITLTIGQKDALEQLMKQWVKAGSIDLLCIQVMWERFAMKLPDTTETDSRAGLVLLGMVASAEVQTVNSNKAVLNTIGLGSGDFALIKSTCEVLLKLVVTKVRLTPDDDIVSSLKKILIEGFSNFSQDYYIPVCFQAIDVIYQLSDSPDTICTYVLKQVCAAYEHHRNSNAENDKVNPVAMLSRLVSLVGHIALRQMLYLDVAVFSELKRRNALREEANDKKNKGNKKNSRTSKTSVSAAGSTTTTPNTSINARSVVAPKSRQVSASYEQNVSSDDMGLTGAVADDQEAELIHSVCEKDIVCGSGILAELSTLVLNTCRDPVTFSDPSLQTAAALSMAKMMLVSSEFCEKNLQLLVSLMERSSLPTLRCNLVIAMGDMSYRFPNVVEPWSAHIYSRLHDPSLLVRRTTVIVLSNLIMNEMVKVKGQISDLALCIVDPEDIIAAMACSFFFELAKKGNALYNVMPDIISRLSSPDLNLPEQKFQLILKHVINLITKERQLESLVEKLCLRFQAAQKERQWRDLAYCLTLMPYTERSLRRLLNNVAMFADKLHEPVVYNSFTSIIANTGKNAKQDIKNILEELEAKIEECRTRGTRESPPPQNAHKTPAPAGQKTAPRTKGKSVRRLHKPCESSPSSSELEDASDKDEEKDDNDSDIFARPKTPSALQSKKTTEFSNVDEEGTENHDRFGKLKTKTPSSRRKGPKKTELEHDEMSDEDENSKSKTPRVLRIGSRKKNYDVTKSLTPMTRIRGSSNIVESGKDASEEVTMSRTRRSTRNIVEGEKDENSDVITKSNTPPSQRKQPKGSASSSFDCDSPISSASSSPDPKRVRSSKRISGLTPPLQKSQNTPIQNQQTVLRKSSRKRSK